jgi:hypothetical protein
MPSIPAAPLLAVFVLLALTGAALAERYHARQLPQFDVPSDDPDAPPQRATYAFGWWGPALCTAANLGVLVAAWSMSHGRIGVTALAFALHLALWAFSRLDMRVLQIPYRDGILFMVVGILATVFLRDRPFASIGFAVLLWGFTWVLAQTLYGGRDALGIGDAACGLALGAWVGPYSDQYLWAMMFVSLGCTGFAMKLRGKATIRGTHLAALPFMWMAYALIVVFLPYTFIGIADI